MTQLTRRRARAIEEERRHSSSSTTTSSDSSSNSSKRRRSSRGKSCIHDLAKEIVLHGKRTLFITGAGLSVASGVRPFRGSSGVWTQVIWNTATREAFRKNPLEWYNSFWLPYLTLPENPRPNAGHLALQQIVQEFGGCNIITQNVDGLHRAPMAKLIEAHGRLGLYKCLPADEDDTDTDSDTDDDDDRDVHLGHRRKSRTSRPPCVYQKAQSLTVHHLEPSSVRVPLSSTTNGNKCSTKSSFRLLKEAPRCPGCGNSVAPQALLFDEGYHSHDFYQFQKMEHWIAEAEIIVFVGTSFAVTLTEVALEHAREKGLPVYNFNTQDFLAPNTRLNAENIPGPSQETLPRLLEDCRRIQRAMVEQSKLKAATSSRRKSPRRRSKSKTFLSKTSSPEVPNTPNLLEEENETMSESVCEADKGDILAVETASESTSADSRAGECSCM